MRNISNSDDIGTKLMGKTSNSNDIGTKEFF